MLRLLVFCFCLVLALIAANLMYSVLSQPTEVLSGAAGDLLYVSTFSTFNEDWDLYESQQSARIVDEQLEIEVGVAQTAAWSAASPRFEDFDASCHGGRA